METRNLSAKYIVKEHSALINDGNDLFYVYAHYPTTEPDVMVMPFVSKVNAELFCEAMNAENERREADTVKHGHYNYIKYLYLVDGYYVVNETMKCSECNNQFLNDGCNYCDKCGAKLDKEPRFFRKKTIFVEGEDTLIPISHTEYKRAEEWVYEDY